MKILHISLGLPPHRTGGLTKYSVDLMISQKELLHEVSLLYPGHYNISGTLKIRKNKDFNGIHVFEIINPLPVSLLGGIKEPDKFMKSANKTQYLKILDEIKPDVIHLHSLMGIHKELFEAAKEQRIKIVFTTHDYFGICPKVNLMDRDGILCNNYEDGKKCAQCNVTGYSMLKIYLMQSKTYRKFKNSKILKKVRNYHKNKSLVMGGNAGIFIRPLIEEEEGPKYINLRSYYLEMLAIVDIFHFNSSIAETEYKNYLDTTGLVLPLTHRDIRDLRKLKLNNDPSKPLNLTYLGPVDKYKGFFLLKESLEQLENQKNWHLNVYGDSIIEGIDYDPEYYTFHGRYQYNELKHIFDNTDLLIIPSIWKETFGFIGLEALSYGVPILVSEYVGMKDIITDGETGIIFEPKVSNLKDHLIRILNNRDILERMSRNILKMDFPYLMDRHVNEIIELYDQ